MNRAQLQQFAKDRVQDAKALLAAKRWSGAYYLAGYAVECGLKACILARIERTGVIFEERKFAEQCWTHDLERLLSLAQLTDPLEADLAANEALSLAWKTVIDWNEASHYQRKSKKDALALFEAINPKHGVLSWIKKHW